ncbi:MAG: DUF4923 family protein [Prevotellaceae bacterium]|jgi:hypothetical protein|nr:DUF4923 family protein [Prevotellaceae bacterium]
MKKKLSATLLVAFVLGAGTAQAQSWKDLLNSDLFSKENVEKVVGAVTGTTAKTDMTGTWSYTGAAVEFESDNLLAKAGGTVASSTVESKLNEQLKRVGITAGKLSFTFNADSTFTATLAKRTLSGSYSYDQAEKKVNLKFVKLVGLNATVSSTSSTMDLLFDSDKLLQLITYLSSKSSNSTLQTISSLASNYDGMMLGLAMEKK